MIYILDRQENTLAVANYDLPDGLHFYNDLVTTKVDTGVSVLTVTFDKSHPDSVHVKEGNRLLYLMENGRYKKFEISIVDSDVDVVEVIAEDASRQLLNSEIDGFKLNGSVVDFIKKTLGKDTGWQIRIDQSGGLKQTLEWTETVTKAKRLDQIAKRFDIEIAYDYGFSGNKAIYKYVDIFKRRGKDVGQRLEVGCELKGVKRTADITDLATALKGVGQAEGDKHLTLKGYTYDDERYYVNPKNGVLYDRQAGEQWADDDRSENGYILKTYQSEAKSQKTLFDETLRQLKNRNAPKVTYSVDFNYFPDGVELGDFVTIVDHQFYTKDEGLYIKARVVELRQSQSDQTQNVVELSNFEELPSGISAELSRLSGLLKEYTFNFNQLPFVLTIDSSRGNVFQNGKIETTLTATVTRGGLDVTDQVDKFEWTRESYLNEASDEVWNETHKTETSATLKLTNKDIEVESDFRCIAMKGNEEMAMAYYLIKDLSVQIFNQEDEPKGARYSDVWRWEENGINKIYTYNDKGQLEWQDVIKKTHLHTAYASVVAGEYVIDFSFNPEGKEYMGIYTSQSEEAPLDPKLYKWTKIKGDPGGPGKDGRPGLPGKDGQNSYVHQAYANKDTQGKIIDFSLTDTNRTFLGMYSDNTSSPSTDPSDYKWVYVGDEQAVNNLRDEISNQLNSLSADQQSLRVILEGLPTPDELNKNLDEVKRQQEYLDALKMAVDSNGLALRDRIAIIEANVGKGKLTLEAIKTYLFFGEEGVLIGKADDPVQLRLANDRLEIISGDKAVAWFTNDQMHITNATVTGVFDVAYHSFKKETVNGKRYTYIVKNV
ncbi:phage tail spike protein [Atopobacter phocae]|uniref:phage tail spike protein n=1 Tax=Atopobacter phocae TaxID=136492 RepID=UPI0004724FAE|nr:phage tail spike protein [Atopobacter phocae]